MRTAKRTRRKLTIEVESLENMTLLSGLTALTHATAAVVYAPVNPVVLGVTTRGPYAYTRSAPDVGAAFQFLQFGYAKGVGNFGVAGSINTVGFVANGRATGTLTFSTIKGTFTLQLTGPVQRGFAPLPSVFAWKVVAATGGYTGSTSSGTVVLALHRASSSPNSGGGTAVMTFRTNTIA
jgi:hypothetical protein